MSASDSNALLGNYLLTDDAIQFRDAYRDFLSGEVTSETIRASLVHLQTGELSISRAECRKRHAGLNTKIGALGILSAAIPESRGGLGSGISAATVLIEESAYALVPLPIFETMFWGVVPLSFADLTEDGKKLLERIASGAALVTGEGFGDIAKKCVQPLSGTLTGVSHLAHAEEIIALRDVSGVPTLMAVSTASVPQDSLKAQATLDVAREYVNIKSENLPWRTIATIPKSFDASQPWKLLVAAELVGLARRVREMIVEYAKTRRQFGKQIGSFQAVQQKLADIHVWIDSAQALLRAASWCADNDPRQLQEAAAGAAGYACEWMPKAIEVALQLHGGIAFTYEFDLHLYLRRAHVVATLVGGAETQYIQISNGALSGSTGS